MSEVFISYKRDQRDRVEVISNLLKDENVSVWFDANLEVGNDEGFDAEIEREIKSAYCVLVCWTPAATRSIYVKAEAKKGLDHKSLLPVFLEECSLPIPFNAIDTVNLSSWNGEMDDPNWRRVLSQIKEMVDHGKRDQKARAEHSKAAYDRIDDMIYPGTLALLSRRITSHHQMDAAHFQDGIEALLEWLKSISEKELHYQQHGWELTDRQSGGDAWRFWDSGGAAARAEEIARVRNLLLRLDETLVKSRPTFKDCDLIPKHFNVEHTAENR